MKKPTVKTSQKIKKFVSDIKTRFFPTPYQMVDQMKTSNSYPYNNGRPYWSIASKIVKSKTIDPLDKADLLLDLYGKYYICQQAKCVQFAVFENYYEEFMIPQSDGSVYKHKPRYEKRFNEMIAENSYIVNRCVRSDINKIMNQAREQGVNKLDFIASLDERAQGIIYLSSSLQDDFHEEGKKQFNVYISSKEEDYMQDLLCERFLAHHPSYAQEDATVSIDSVPAIKGLGGIKLPIPAAIAKEAEAIKDATAEAIKSTSKDKLPEQ